MYSSIYMINIPTSLSIRYFPSILDLRNIGLFFAGILYHVGHVRAVKVTHPSVPIVSSLGCAPRHSLPLDAGVTPTFVNILA